MWNFPVRFAHVDMKSSMNEKRGWDTSYFRRFSYRDTDSAFAPGSPGIGGIVEVNGTSETKRQAEVEDSAEKETCRSKVKRRGRGRKKMKGE